MLSRITYSCNVVASSHSIFLDVEKSDQTKRVAGVVGDTFRFRVVGSSHKKGQKKREIFFRPQKGIITRRLERSPAFVCNKKCNTSDDDGLFRFRSKTLLARD